MQQKSVPASQISSVTGVPLADIVSRVADVAPQNVLGGTILAGDSWLAGQDKTALAEQAFGQPVSNVAVGGFKTDDALNQLNNFVNNGGVFKSGSTVVLDIGGNDLLQGVSRDTVKSNIDQILSILDREGVKVILSGAPAVGSISDVTSSTNLKMDSLYKEVAQDYKNVTVVDAMSGLLNNKSVVDASGFHVNTSGQTDFLNQLASATDKKATPADVVAEITQPQKNLALTTENINKLASQILAQNTTGAWSGGLSPQTSALYMASDLAKSGVTDITQVGKTQDGIINKVTGEKLVSGYGERTGGNLWSGSYSGKGNTGFGVEFDDSGKPIFFTQGASSSTLKKDLLKAAAVAAVAFGIPGAEGLFGGLGATDAALTAGDLAIGGGSYAGTGLTAAQLSAAGLSASEIAALTANDLAIGGGSYAGLTSAELAAAGLTTEQIAALTAQDLAIGGGGATANGLLTPALAAGGAATLMGGAGGLTATTGGITGLTAGAGGVTGLTTAGGLTGANALLGGSTLGSTLGGAAVGSTLAGMGAGAGGSLLGAAAGSNLGSLLSSGLTLGGGLLQSQTSKEAAQRAQAMIDAETAAAKQAAQFRPVGMTTRFGTSQFGFDPTTGQLTSAGYTLSPEAKNAQDRFITLAGQGLTQAEGAQAQFAPLQTGATSLFTLGNKYLAQSPQDVAKNYLAEQMALLQPSRELEFANLQTKLRNQGRLGLSVAQGGTMGATTPELQALYNARAQQEAQLAANAQQFGQQQVQFGAGLLGTGAQTMGQYYGGQQAAYAPYTTALGQAQALEQLGQQPLQMGAAFGQQAAAAGAKAGEAGLYGARLSTALATSPAATTNPYSTLLGGVGSSNQFGQFVGGLFGGTPTTAMSAPATTFGTGNYYGSQDLGLYL